MDRKEQLKFCKICTKKEVSFEKGIICSLTGEHAIFTDVCPDFIENESLKKDLDFKKSKAIKNDKSIAITLFVSGLITIFILPILINKLGVNFNKPIVSNLIGALFLIIGILSFLKIKDITTQNLMNMKKVIFAIIGAIFGLPLSYYFQPEMVRQKMSLLDYITKINEVFDQKDLVGNVVFGVIVFAVLGFTIGYFVDKNAVKKTD